MITETPKPETPYESEYEAVCRAWRRERDRANELERRLSKQANESWTLAAMRTASQNALAFAGSAPFLMPTRKYIAALEEAVALRKPLTCDDHAAAQGVKPATEASLKAMAGTWPGDDKDGFEEAVREARRTDVPETNFGDNHKNQ
jgi:hypothetical protein